ncbi:MAG: glycosyltransferase family 2 protein [Gracilibacteraceae bacterium]|jgi:hypothetical protein|nr:glycosyltransferase family 2 protein [Gracilibacteraceae bacterium]
MKFTACLITKNEERCLARCLASLGDAVDAIVVADTGSGDRTRAIAREWGARVIEIPWRDDFAWAKNQALAAADGDWVFFPDADEYFPPGGAAALRAWIEKYPTGPGPGPGPDAIALRRYESADAPAASYTSVLRAFRLTPALRYTGAIHEQLTRAGEPPLIADAPPETVFLLHDGYSAGRAEAKTARNMRIITGRIAAGDDDPLLLFHLSKTLDRRKERERIWEYGSAFLRRDASPSSLCLKAMLLAALALEFTPDRALALKRRAWLKEEALRRFPAHPAACRLAGDECLERGDHAEALRWYARTTRLWETGFEDFGDSDFRQEHSRHLVYTRLGRCRQLSGDSGGARADFAAALELEPDNAAAAAGYIECSRTEEAGTIAATLSRWQARARSPLVFLAAAREKRCDLLYLHLYDRYERLDRPAAGPPPPAFFVTMQVLVGAWWAAATDCSARARRHPLWGGDPAAWWAALAEPERTEFGEIFAEAAAGCLLAAGGWQPCAAGRGGDGAGDQPPDPVLFLRALAAVTPPALSAALRLCLGEETEPAGEGSEMVGRVAERLAALGAPEPIRLMWREALACLT